MSLKLKILFSLIFITGIGIAKGQQILPALNKKFRGAGVKTVGDLLTVSTGKVERSWKWTGEGLVTVSFRNFQTGKEWAEIKPQFSSDWAYFGLIDETEGKLVSLTAQKGNDEGFTSDYLEVIAEVWYPSVASSVKYQIWAYPDAPGILTRVWFKGEAHKYYREPANNKDDSVKQKFIATGRVDYVPVDMRGKRRRYVGYYNDTQHRNTPQTPIYREELKAARSSGGNINWANMISIEDKNEGLILVKESNKCVNQYGTDTGGFLADSNGISNTGTSLYPKDIDTAKYKWAWASWAILYNGNGDYRELAVKQFDRLRFPTDMKRDMYSLVCTWGNSKNGRDGRNYATEKEVLAEMKATADLGIDLLLIDDGWQVSLKSKGPVPSTENGWKPDPAAYPEGWKNVAALKNKLKLDLGLWGIAQRIPLNDMVWNWKRIQMKQFKLDFANFKNHDALNDVMQKAREFMIRTNHQCIISWDLTENAPRYGYFWAREYGNLHFMNRKDEVPVNVVYVPWLCLRDYWYLSAYNNLNKYQLTVQNPEITDRELSDAYKHSAAYCVATTLMGVPEFMALPRFFSDQAKASIKELLKIYKNNRKEIWESYQFPIGEKPSNAGFTGFQSFRPGKKEGYLMIFRELHAPQDHKDIAVHFLNDEKVMLTDLKTGEKWQEVISSKGMMPVSIEKPAHFKFIKYRIIN